MNIRLRGPGHAESTSGGSIRPYPQAAAARLREEPTFEKTRPRYAPAGFLSLSLLPLLQTVFPVTAQVSPQDPATTDSGVSLYVTISERICSGGSICGDMLPATGVELTVLPALLLLLAGAALLSLSRRRRSTAINEQP
jgi:LPXTG-motif cell wall-anchored protein